LYQPPSKYTGELFGVEYLFQQSGIVLNTQGEELDKQIDEGFVDIDDHEDLIYTAPPDTEDNNTAACLLESDSGEDETEEESSASLQEDEVAVDAAGIPGWDRVDDLAKALTELDGLAVSTSQAQEIEHLYNRLVDYDKRPILFHPRRQRPTRGRFARNKQSGHMSVEAMKRCFLSAGSPASSPSKSRLAEAICLRLCDIITQPTKSKLPSGRQVYTSRWKAVLSEYNNIRVRLLNSEALLERTCLTLFHINETTLIKWYKDTSRVSEVRTLLQGLKLPTVQPCTAEKLPEVNTQPKEPPEPPPHPHVSPEVEDTSGEARVRGTKSAPVPPPAEAGPSAPSQAVASEVDVKTQPKVSRTTEWRHKKTGKINNERKTYTCKVCNEPMSSAGHTQFRGQRYCPFAPGQIPREEWLAERRKAATSKKKQ
jgi:hypothetical protein